MEIQEVLEDDFKEKINIFVNFDLEVFIGFSLCLGELFDLQEECFLVFVGSDIQQGENVFRFFVLFMV